MFSVKKVTVILLAHNVKNYVRQSLDSILAQKVNFDYDIIVGDDGSSDGTVEILQEYSNRFPNIIRLFLTPRIKRSHGGDYINFSNLYRKTQSEYITILDGDDYWINVEKLQKQVDFLDHNKDFTVCGHNYFIEHLNGERTPAFDEVEVRNSYSCVCENLEQMLLGGSCPYMQTSSLVYRNVFKKNNQVHDYFNHYMYKGDLIRTLLHASQGKSRFINEIMSVYRITGKGDWSKVSQIQKCISHIKFYKFHKKNTFDKKYSTHCNRLIRTEIKNLIKGLL